MNRLPASQRYRRHSIRWKRYEKQRHGHQLQVDVKFIEPLGQQAPRPVDLATCEQLASAVIAVIEAFYNPRRRSSTLGYLSPADYESQHRAGQPTEAAA